MGVSVMSFLTVTKKIEYEHLVLMVMMMMIMMMMMGTFYFCPYPSGSKATSMKLLHLSQI
jgi:hypothetical protein